MASVTAVVVAAGRSRRMGTDKLWLEIWGRPVWRWSLDAVLAVPKVERAVIVVPAEARDRFAAALPERHADRCLIAPGGDRRSDSVLAGLDALGDVGVADDTVVLVHDAARPAAGRDLIERVLAAAGADGGVVPVVPVADTLLRASSLEPVERDQLVAAQTPQLGRMGDLRAALRGGRSFTDEASALRAVGVEVRTVAGDVANRKLTDAGDEPLLRATLKERALAGMEAPVASPQGRAGIGFDAHRLEAGRRLRLGGVDFPDEPRGLAGHSDGDAALHAVVDSLLGASSQGDIGAVFPSSDDAWRDADSSDLVRRVVGRVAAAGWRPASLDVVIIAVRPSIAPRRGEMTQRIAALVGVGPERVSVKATTSDGLGFAGEEGIAAYAIAVLERA